jgi:diaminopimelate epimerase
MEYKFVKTHNAGNDFILFDCIKENPIPRFTREEIISICHRNFGVGGDGILILTKDGDRCRMRIYNSDGSLAKMCGNGLSALSAYVYERGYTSENEFEVATDSGIKIPYVSKEDGKIRVKINMGEPELTPEKIPVKFDEKKLINNK